MSEDFVAAMRRAMAAARTAEAVDVNAVIQQALGAAGLTGAATGAPRMDLPRMRLPLGDAVRTLREGQTARWRRAGCGRRRSRR